MAGSAAAINHLVDRKVDAVMARTQHRPLPSGHLESWQVLGFAVIIGVCGFGLLLAFTNALTAVLTFASLIGLRSYLYAISQAGDAAEHRHRWCGRARHLRCWGGRR
jgi:heme O synthase-like polyprenyltransferase